MDQHDDTSAPLTLSRRAVLQSAAVGGVLVIPAPLLWAQSKPAAAAAAPRTLTAFVRIAADDTVTLVMPMVEMGQGTYTGISQLIAEELEVDPAQIKLEHAPANQALYANPAMGVQITGGSTAIRGSWLPLRQAGAVARTVLVTAAAQTWGVPADQCQAERGSVVHAASGRRLGYGALVAKAAALPLPKEVPLKPASAFKVIGKDPHRLDSPAKVHGSAQFGIDVRLPGMRVATVAASPAPGAQVVRVDAAAARKVRGVRQVVQLPDLVAVVADHLGAARKGMTAANVQWSEGTAARYDTASLEAELRAAAQQSGVSAPAAGGAAPPTEAALAALREASGARVLEADYFQPLLAHATMEPMNCTVRLGRGRCDIWTGTQVPVVAQAAAAQVAGLAPERVTVHNQYLGGGFGRRLEVDMVVQAVRVAKAVSAPVKVVWTREEDMRHDAYRPAKLNRLQATLDAQGRPVAWHHRAVGSSILARWMPPAFQNGIDSDAIENAAGPYDFTHTLVQYVRQELPAGLTTGWWRGVGAMQNAFPVECFMDELAHAAGQDPLAFRHALLGSHPRARQVLDMLRDKAGWSTPPGPAPAGVRMGRGMALTFAFGSYAAQAVDVAVAADGTARVSRVVTVVDCGTVVSPRMVEAQVQSGTVFGLSAALWGDITLKGGAVEQSNFHDYRIMRMSETPQMQIHLVPSTEPPGGIGEVATVVIAPAVVNAVFAATGQRLRRLPVRADALKA